MTVRTARLAVGITTLGTLKVVYTCPSGHTTILKHALLAFPLGVPSRTYVEAHSGARGVALVDTTSPSGAQLERTPWLVLEPGDTLQVLATGVDFVFWFSGTVLEGVEPT